MGPYPQFVPASLDPFDRDVEQELEIVVHDVPPGVDEDLVIVEFKPPEVTVTTDIGITTGGGQLRLKRAPDDTLTGKIKITPHSTVHMEVLVSSSTDLFPEENVATKPRKPAATVSGGNAKGGKPAAAIQPTPASAAPATPAPALPPIAVVAPSHGPAAPPPVATPAPAAAPSTHVPLATHLPAAAAKTVTPGSTPLPAPTATPSVSASTPTPAPARNNSAWVRPIGFAVAAIAVLLTVGMIGTAIHSHRSVPSAPETDQVADNEATNTPTVAPPAPTPAPAPVAPPPAPPTPAPEVASTAPPVADPPAAVPPPVPNPVAPPPAPTPAPVASTPPAPILPPPAPVPVIPPKPATPVACNAGIGFHSVSVKGHSMWAVDCSDGTLRVCPNAHISGSPSDTLGVCVKP